MKAQYKIEANWTEAGETHTIKRLFDTKKNATEYTKIFKKELSNVTIEKGNYVEGEWVKAESTPAPTKSNKLEGTFQVVNSGGRCVGAMSWETPYLELEDLETGKLYVWASEKIEHIGLYGASRGTTLTLKAFHRPGEYGEHLYRVAIV